MRNIYLLLMTPQLLSCQHEQVKVDFASIYQTHEITKIEIINENNGQHKIITDPKRIESWVNRVGNITFIRDENQEERAPTLLYPYSVKAYHDEQEIGDFVTGKLKGVYYKSNPAFNKQVKNIIRFSQLTRD